MYFKEKVILLCTYILLIANFYLIETFKINQGDHTLFIRAGGNGGAGGAIAPPIFFRNRINSSI